MISNQRTPILLIAGIFVGALITAVIYSVWLPHSSEESGRSSGAGEPQPLYWVAPMDPNYRRDKPGQSPMGMDLIPVYEEGNSDDGAGPGTIRISPDVVNNLGVRTAVAQRMALNTEIRTVGYVQYDEDQLFHIHPRVEGWIEKLHVTATGDPVTQAQPLYEIYSPALVNAQEELLLAFERKNSRLIEAAEERLKALQFPSRAINALKKDGKVRQRVTFFSPHDGVVDNLNIRQGFFVKPGTTLMSIGTLDQVWVEAEVFERQASLVSTGAPVTMTLDFLPGISWLGKVDYVYPALDAKTRTAKVRLRFDNKSGVLRPNMFAQVVIHPEGSEEMLMVPSEAVIRTGSAERVVLALGDGRYKSIEVSVGRSDSQHTEIISGLAPGERVVVSAQFLLDSESSKSSDFKRMDHRTESGSAPRTVSSADTFGTINTVMPDRRVLNISRAAIEKWNRPPATMDFVAGPEIDLSTLAPGMEVAFQFQVVDGDFIVTDILPPSPDDDHAPSVDSPRQQEQ